MKWPSSLERRERKIAARRERPLRQALQLYGFNDGDGMPTDEELQQERATALVEFLRDFRLFYGTPGPESLEERVNDAIVSEARRISEAGGEKFYAPQPKREPHVEASSRTER